MLVAVRRATGAKNKSSDKKKYSTLKYAEDSPQKPVINLLTSAGVAIKRLYLETTFREGTQREGNFRSMIISIKNFANPVSQDKNCIKTKKSQKSSQFSTNLNG